MMFWSDQLSERLCGRNDVIAEFCISETPTPDIQSQIWIQNPKKLCLKQKAVVMDVGGRLLCYSEATDSLS